MRATADVRARSCGSRRREEGVRHGACPAGAATVRPVRSRRRPGRCGGPGGPGLDRGHLTRRRHAGDGLRRRPPHVAGQRGRVEPGDGPEHRLRDRELQQGPAAGCRRGRPGRDHRPQHLRLRHPHRRAGDHLPARAQRAGSRHHCVPRRSSASWSAATSPGRTDAPVGTWPPTGRPTAPSCRTSTRWSTARSGRSRSPRGSSTWAGPSPARTGGPGRGWPRSALGER